MFGCFFLGRLYWDVMNLYVVCVCVSRLFVEYVLGLKLGVNTLFFGVNGVNMFFGWSI